MSELASTEWLIEPRPTGPIARGAEIWRYRRMFTFFAHRTILKLYQRTILGFAWIFLRPLLPLCVRVFVFGALFQVGSATRVPYFLFLAVGSAAWELFQSCAMWTTRSLELNGGMLSRLYVPRLILPIATMAPGFIYFAIHLGVIAVTLVYYRIQDGVWYVDTTWILVAPIAAALIVLAALAIGLFTSVAAVGARDVRFGLGYVLEFMAYVTPVYYPLAIVPGHVQWALMVNPLAVLVIAFRGAILGGEGPDPWAWVSALAAIGVVLAAGLTFFHRAEAEAIDNL